MYIYIIIPPAAQEVYHITNSLRFVWGLFRAYLGFQLYIYICGFRVFKPLFNANFTYVYIYNINIHNIYIQYKYI